MPWERVIEKAAEPMNHGTAAVDDDKNLESIPRSAAVKMRQPIHNTPRDTANRMALLRQAARSAAKNTPTAQNHRLEPAANAMLMCTVCSFGSVRGIGNDCDGGKESRTGRDHDRAE